MSEQPEGLVDEFLVRRRTTCSNCGGWGAVQHAAWTAFYTQYPEGSIPGLTDAALHEATQAWFVEHGYIGALETLPSQEHLCADCEGVGKVEAEISLAYALEELGVMARIERLEGPKVSRLGPLKISLDEPFEEASCNAL